ncbi:MAG: hypothetical protein O3B09_04300, partial [Proteobacteria bacterium]|nr:hypothetical protein [Pseudomonadota bacterium]
AAKAQAKVNAIKSLFIPNGFCEADGFSFLCWLGGNWNPDNKLITFNVILPLILAFVLAYGVKKLNKLYQNNRR